MRLKVLINLVYCAHDSPLGLLYLVANSTSLIGCYFTKNYIESGFAIKEGHNKIVIEAKAQLDEYFKCERKVFTVPLAFSGTEFQNSVWQSLCEIPYGSTWTYKEQAQSIGREKAVRAVGSTNGKNPLSIFIPCHRVVGSSGKLTGYAGGIDKKEFLLDLEKSQIAD